LVNAAAMTANLTIITAIDDARNAAHDQAHTVQMCKTSVIPSTLVTMSLLEFHGRAKAHARDGAIEPRDLAFTNCLNTLMGHCPRKSPVSTGHVLPGLFLGKLTQSGIK
jgi:hypothetical protein